jgi:diaminopimelate epimerase
MKKVPKKIPFMKFSGAGNDFIVVDNRNRVVDPKKMSAFVASVCTPHLSVGADGLIFIEKAPKAHFRWRFFNNDGGEADFCGNGARCVARFAYLKQIAPKKMRFEGAAGMVEAVVDGESVTVRVPDPTGVQLNIHLDLPPHRRRRTDLAAPSQASHIVMTLEGHAINTGVPHFVYFVNDTSTAEVIGLGQQIRNHEAFMPEGTNVDFVEVVNRRTIRIRTYERGVEDETLACGSGAIAAALIAAVVHKAESPVTVMPLSGSSLTVSFKVDGPRFTSIALTGEVRTVYEGSMHSDAWEYKLR